MSHQQGASQAGFSASFDANGYKIDHRSETEQRSETRETKKLLDGEEIHSKQKKSINLEELKSRESSRIATADDVRALLEAEFQGIHEIQTSREISVEEFNLIESQFRKKLGAKIDCETSVKEEHKLENVLESPQWKSQFGMPVVSKNEIVDVKEAKVVERNYLDPNYATGASVQRTAGPEVTVTTTEYPEGHGSLRRETKQKRHVFEEVVIEGTDKFYEKTSPKKAKKIAEDVEKSRSTGELRSSPAGTYSRGIKEAQNTQDEVLFREHNKHSLENDAAKPSKKRAHQNELVVEDANLFTDESKHHSLFSQDYKIKPMFPYQSKTYAVNQETGTSQAGAEKENVVPARQTISHAGSQQEIVVGDIGTFKEGTLAVEKNRSVEKINQEGSALGKPKVYKKKFNQKEPRFFPKIRRRQEEIVINDPTVYDEVQFLSLKKAKKKAMLYNPRTLPAKFKTKSRTQELTESTRPEEAAAVEVQQKPHEDVGAAYLAGESLEEIVLDDPDLFRESTLTKKKLKLSYGSLERQQRKLEKFEKEIEEKSLKVAGNKHKGLQAEVVIDDPDIFREITLKRKKKEKAAKAADKIMNDILLDISTLNQEAKKSSASSRKEEIETSFTEEADSRARTTVSNLPKTHQKEIVLNDNDVHKENTLKKPEGKLTQTKVVDETTTQHVEVNKDLILPKHELAAVGPVEIDMDISHQKEIVVGGDKVVSEMTQPKQAESIKSSSMVEIDAKVKETGVKKANVVKHQEELVVGDQTIYADRNKPKNIHLAHGQAIHLAEIDDFNLPESEHTEAEKKTEMEKPEKVDKKTDKHKKFLLKKNKKSQGESVVDDSFVYEDATKITFPSEPKEGESHKSADSGAKGFWNWNFGHHKSQPEVIREETHYHEDPHIGETMPESVSAEEGAKNVVVESDQIKDKPGHTYVNKAITTESQQKEVVVTSGIGTKDVGPVLKEATADVKVIKETVPEKLELQETKTAEIKVNLPTQYIHKPTVAEEKIVQKSDIMEEHKTDDKHISSSQIADKETHEIEDTTKSKEKGKSKFHLPGFTTKPHINFGFKKHHHEVVADEKQVFPDEKKVEINIKDDPAIKIDSKKGGLAEKTVVKDDIVIEEASGFKVSGGYDISQPEISKTEKEVVVETPEKPATKMQTEIQDTEDKVESAEKKDTEAAKPEDHKFKIHLPHIPSPHFNIHLKKTKKEDDIEQDADVDREEKEEERVDERNEDKIKVHLPHFSIHKPHIDVGTHKTEVSVENSAAKIKDGFKLEISEKSKVEKSEEAKDISAITVDTRVTLPTPPVADVSVEDVKETLKIEAAPVQIEVVTTDEVKVTEEHLKQNEGSNAKTNEEASMENTLEKKKKHKIGFNFPHFSLPRPHSKQNETVTKEKTIVVDSTKLVKTDKPIESDVHSEDMEDTSNEKYDDQSNEKKGDHQKFKIRLPKPHLKFGFKKSKEDKESAKQKAAEVRSSKENVKADAQPEEPVSSKLEKTDEAPWVNVLVEAVGAPAYFIDPADIKLCEPANEIKAEVKDVKQDDSTQKYIQITPPGIEETVKHILEGEEAGRSEPITIEVEPDEYKVIVIKSKTAAGKKVAEKIVPDQQIKKDPEVAPAVGFEISTKGDELTNTCVAIPDEVQQVQVGIPEPLSVCVPHYEIAQEEAKENQVSTEKAVAEIPGDILKKQPVDITPRESVEMKTDDEKSEGRTKTEEKNLPEDKPKPEVVSTTLKKESKSKFHLPCIKLKRPFFKKHGDADDYSDEEYAQAEATEDIKAQHSDVVEESKQAEDDTGHKTKKEKEAVTPRDTEAEHPGGDELDDTKEEKVSKKKHHAFTFGSLGRKPAQEEIVVNDTHIYTDSSTLGRRLLKLHKHKDRTTPSSITYIVENNLPESSENKVVKQATNEETPSSTVVKTDASKVEEQTESKQGEILVSHDDVHEEGNVSTVQEIFSESKIDSRTLEKSKDIHEDAEATLKYKKQDELVIGGASIVTEPQTSPLHKVLHKQHTKSNEHIDHQSNQDLSDSGKISRKKDHNKLTSMFHRSSGEYDLEHQKRTNQPLVELISSRPRPDESEAMTPTHCDCSWSLNYRKNLTLDASNRLTFESEYDPDQSISIDNVQLFCPSARRSYKKQIQIDDLDLIKTIQTSGAFLDASLGGAEPQKTSTPIKKTDITAEEGAKPTDETTITPSEGAVSEASRLQAVKWTGTPGKSTSFFSTIPSFAPVHDQQKSPYFVVAAIDFGTTFSGYAFSFKNDVDSIHVMRKWEGGDPGVTNQKIPTTLLLTPEKEFHSFGFTARDFYHDLSPTEAKRWLYFEKFKMALHYDADLTSYTDISAANGTSIKALEVFAHALRFFRNHALQEISEQSNTQLLDDDIRWVITVPAIWKSPAKQFMREAAYEAGIVSPYKNDQLLIALEPEAASIFVRKQRLRQLIPEDVDELKDTRTTSKSNQDLGGERSSPVLHDAIAYLTHHDDSASWNHSLASNAMSLSFQRCPSPTSFPVSINHEIDITDNRFMVADCGGGTVDITVYEMLSATGGRLKELYKASGGPYGSIGIDLEFEKLLVSIFGSDFIDTFKDNRPAGWVDLMMAFESRKRAANPFKTKPLNVSLPFSFIDYYKKIKNTTVESAVRKFNNKDVKWSSQGMLRLLPEAMNSLFQPTLDKVTGAIANVLRQPDVSGVKHIFLVGGFAESPMLQQEIRKHFTNQSRILIPADVSLTILKGAVLYGIDPSIVVIRKSRLTYGLGVLNRFVEGKHPESKKAIKDEVPWCVDVFDHLVLANQSVALGSSVIRSYTPAGSDQKFSLFHIYCSENRNVDYVTDEGVVKCGTLRLDLDDHQWEMESNPSRPASQNIQDGDVSHVTEGLRGRREIQARLTFADTEIKIIALDVATGNYVRATLDFLNK